MRMRGGGRQGTAGGVKRAAGLAALLGAAALWLPGSAGAQLPRPRLRLDSAASRVWFDGTSTFGAFTATSASLSGWAELAAAAQLAGARGQVDVRAATLHTGIGLRDRHLRQELDTDRWPLVSLAVERVTVGPVAAAATGTTPVVLHGVLTVKGRGNAVAFEAAAGFRGDTLVVTGRVPLRFTDVGMKPPAKLLGSVKVHDDFVLRFDGRFLPDDS